MSRPRSRSPHYRRLAWEEPEFHPHEVLEELHGNPRDRSFRHREGPEEHGDFFREDIYPEGRRRTPPFPDDPQFDRHRPEFYHGRLSPRHDTTRYKNQRLSPLKEGAFDMDRRREGSREHFQRFENRAQREPGMSWRREERGRGQGRFRDSSPSMRYGDQRAGERGRKTAQGPNRGRQRENPHHERGTPFQRPRREMDDADRPGYRDEKDLVDTARGGFGGGAQGKFPRGDFRHSGSHFSERNHSNIDNREMPQWQRFEDRRPYKPDFDRQRSPHSVGSSQERFRTSDSRLDGRDNAQDHHFQDNLRDLNFHETRRSPALQERPHTMRYGNRDGPMNHKGRGGGRRGYSQSPGGRTRHPRNPPHLQESSQGYQDLPHEEQRPFREAFHGPAEDEPHWTEEDQLKQWEHDMPGHLDQYHGRDDLNPKMPNQREREWNDQKPNTVTVVTEETLTIKVDMSRPVNQNSPLCYSSDRQLSLDLVNVGRQRLDFLPMLKHSGTYQETDMHTGTFAQEIITLVHLVKDQYFRGNGITLNKRFSTPQAGGCPEEQTEELTLNQRFSSNRGFSLETDLLLDEDEPVFSRLGLFQGLSKQPLRGPGDLRHDLERRRQERLEGVKVTIPGSGVSQQSLGTVSEPDMMSQTDHEEFSSWSGEQSRRWEGSAGPRRGPSNRVNFGPQRRNHRFGNRRQNVHSSPAGPDW